MSHPIAGDAAPLPPYTDPHGHDAAWRRSTSLCGLVFRCGMALSPLGDFLSVRASSGAMSGGGDARVSLLLRGAMIGGLIGAMLIGGRVKGFNWRQVLLAMIALSVLSVTFVAGGMSAAEFAEQAIFVLKVFSFFVFFAALSALTASQFAAAERIVGIVLLAYAFSIVAGGLFSIEMFRSYQADTQIRSGYKGIVYAQNEASALLIVGIAYAYTRVMRFGWRGLEMLLVASLLAASMLVGTKAAAAGTLAVTIAYFYARHGALAASLRAAVVLALLAALAVAAYMVLPGVAGAVDLSVGYFIYQYDNASGDALFTILLSGRNLKFATVWDALGRQGYLALLTGGYPVIRYLVEIDIPDLLLSLGAPVFCFYFMALAGRFFVHGRGAIPRFGKLFFIVLLLIACTAGHVLTSAVVSPYLAIIAVVLQRSRVRGSGPW
jgi:hypothetical protein